MDLGLIQRGRTLHLFLTEDSEIVGGVGGGPGGRVAGRA